jgi:Zn-dependent peptidase ImmA (M78 family)
MSRAERASLQHLRRIYDSLVPQAAPDAEKLALFPLRLEHVAELQGLELVRLPKMVDAGGSEVAGELDRQAGVVRISSALPADFQRYTVAHEIAHYCIHPTLVLAHRDMIATIQTPDRTGLPAKEAEAQRFAARLLMPVWGVSWFFRTMFRIEKFVHASLSDDDLQDLRLTRENGQVTLRALRANRRVCSLAIARAGQWRGFSFVPLRARFGVSATAMAIRLEEMRLVV